MKHENLLLMVAPPVCFLLAAGAHALPTQGLELPMWGFILLSFATAIACLVRAVFLLRMRKPLGFLCAALGIIYLAFLAIAVTPGKTKLIAQQFTPVIAEPAASINTSPPGRFV